MKRQIATAALALSLAFGGASAALGHGSMEPSHGGAVTMSGETLFELVKTAKGVDVYISEEDEPLNASAYDGKLIVTTAAGTKSTFNLTPAGGNRLTVAGLKPGSGTKVVVSLVNKTSGAKAFATFRYK